MCGVAGFFDSSLAGEQAQPLLRRMADAIRHRGPDSDGYWFDETLRVGLAHRRLSILDLSAAGAQPMASPSGRFVVVFNGEIYNHHAIRAELLAAEPALSFRGHSDTEVMLAALDRWGVPATLERLNGMFAIALVDRHEGRLHLIRDRAGEKPLYVGTFGAAIVFGSELKALRRHPAWRADLDPGAFRSYLQYGWVPGPRSIFAHVVKVMPGHDAVVDLRAQGAPRIEQTAYWSAAHAVRAGLADRLQVSDEEAIDRLEALLDDAVSLRMEADVPLGAFLSGGIDSTMIVALMQRRASRPVKTFSIGFWEKRFNEADSARAIAGHLGTDHTELYVTPQQALDVVQRLPTIYDEPFADSSQIPTFLVAQLARRSVTVALSGDGGDELFWGYDRYPVALSMWRTMSAAPQWAKVAGSRIIKALPVGALNALGAWLPQRYSAGRTGDRAHKVADRLALRSFDEVYRSVLSLWAGAPQIVSRDLPEGAQLPPPDSLAEVPLESERMMAWDLQQYLPDDILVKVDRATMAVSLEGRMPLLDHRVIEFAWRVPLSQKRRGNERKWLLKQALYRLVPRHLVDRPKQGFGVPVEFWLRKELRQWASDLLAPESLRRDGLIDVKATQQLLQQHFAGSRSWAMQLWAVLMFQAWRAEWSHP